MLFKPMTQTKTVVSFRCLLLKSKRFGILQNWDIIPVFDQSMSIPASKLFGQSNPTCDHWPWHIGVSENRGYPCGHVSKAVIDHHQRNFEIFLCSGKATCHHSHKSYTYKCATASIAMSQRHPEAIFQ